MRDTHLCQDDDALWLMGCAVAAPVEQVAPPPSQQTAAPLSRQVHNKLLAEAFSGPAAVARSLKPLDDDARQASVVQEDEPWHDELAATKRPPARVTGQMIRTFLNSCALARQMQEQAVAEVAGLGPASRVISVGPGTGALMPTLQVHSPALMVVSCSAGDMH